MRYEKKQGIYSLLAVRLNVGEQLVAEMSRKDKSSYIASTPVYSEKDDRSRLATGLLCRRFAVGSEIGVKGDEPQGPIWVKKYWEMRKRVSHQINLELGGEPNFALYEAKADGQEVLFTTCEPGEILDWKQSEKYGKIRIAKGIFMASFAMNMETYTSKDIGIITLSKTGGKFMEISGNGTAFFEIPGNAIVKELKKNESYDVFPGHLVGFTEHIDLEMKEAGNEDLRYAEGNTFVIRCTANSDEGGEVYICTGKISD